ncbi:putative E3 ubiquitin-protein ligase ipaH7.8 [compost metagenome]
MSEDPASGEFFRLLNDLGESTDFTQAYRALCERVWRMLKAASDSTRLREELFEFVAHPNTCSDGVILVFSQLEVLVLVQEAYEAGTAVGTEYALIDLARGLGRLDSVERIALRDIAARRAARIRVDEVEVRLFYRIKLAQRLGLPGQPQTMRFANMANVTAAQLDSAAAEVLAAETPEAMKSAIASRDFWITFLKSRYGERFDEVNKPFFARLEALEADKGSMRDQVYRTRVETIQQRRGADEQRLIETLTTQIWNSIPDQVTRL